ncbi:MAG: GNAT family N-acetyltransferase [Myxococcota bacterium]
MLSSSAVAHESMLEVERKKLPRYPIPTALIGRLAVDESTRGLGLGRELLMDAIKRTITISTHVGIYAVEVYAKDNVAKSFYGKYGFESLNDEDRHMFFSIKAAEAAFA